MIAATFHTHFVTDYQLYRKMVKKVLSNLPLTNQNGGYYTNGNVYEWKDKVRVANVYFELLSTEGPEVTCRRLAKETKVSRGYAYKVLKELRYFKTVLDPALKSYYDGNKKGMNQLTHQQQVFLLAMRSRHPTAPNYRYIKELQDTYDINVSSSYITRFFANRFIYKGRFRKPNNVPLDKWKLDNLVNFVRFQQNINMVQEAFTALCCSSVPLPSNFVPPFILVAPVVYTYRTLRNDRTEPSGLHSSTATLKIKINHGSFLRFTSLHSHSAELFLPKSS